MSVALTAPLDRVIQGVRRVIGADSLPAAIQEVTELNNIRDAVLAETAAKLAPGMIGGFTAMVVPDDREFRKLYPHWREALLRLCRARIVQAEKRLEPILAEARARYIERYGLSEDEVEDDTVVRRARRRIAGLQGRLKQIESDRPEADTWQCAHILLAGETADSSGRNKRERNRSKRERFA